MGKITGNARVAIVIASILAATAGPAHALFNNKNFPGSTVARINGEGFRICKAMGDNGYSAVARGYLSDGGGQREGGFRYFQIRTCFETHSQCEHFISRIHHQISGIQRLDYLRCKSRAD